jgi:hypothetical protein
MIVHVMGGVHRKIGRARAEKRGWARDTECDILGDRKTPYNTVTP